MSNGTCEGIYDSDPAMPGVGVPGDILLDVRSGRMLAPTAGVAPGDKYWGIVDTSFEDW